MCEAVVREPGGGVHGGVLVVVADGNSDPNQGRIGAVVPNGIGNEVETGGVFARDHTVARLVPIQDQALLITFGDYVAIDRDGVGTPRNSDGDNVGGRGQPTRTWDAILGRVRRGTCTL